MNKYPVNIGNRLTSMLLDHVLMSIIMAVLLAPFMTTVATKGIVNPEQDPMGLFHNSTFYITLGAMTLYLCKDCIGGRSLAKRILKLQVLDNRTNMPATPLQCLLRNFLIVFWPLEVVMIFINPERRLGDRIAGTKVAPFSKEAQPPTTSYLQLPVCLVLGYAFLYLIMLPLH